IQTLCNPLVVQPALKQFSQPWGSMLYDDAQNWAASGQKTTIGRWGCHLTSAVMLINYHAARQGSVFRTSPDALNTWLQANSHDFQTGGDVYGGDVAKYARLNGIFLTYQGSCGQSGRFRRRQLPLHEQS